jgi:2-polyprenyl-3-methyl-5-hydroxy-6-metoxy-1,4-benzoquinol methylase
MSSADRQARAVYESWHERVQCDHATADRPWHALVYAHLEDADLAGRAVLEIGCGRGELACELMASTRAPARLIAADFAHAAVRLGRARAASRAVAGLSWMVADVQRIGLPDASVDTVVSCETIEHLPDPVQALREFRRVLRPGGRVILTTPNYFGPFGLYRAYLRMRGRRYTEGDQPICRLTMLPRTLFWMWRAGLRVRAVDAAGQYLLAPGRLPWEPGFLERLNWLLWPLGLHSLVVAEKR